MKKNFIEPEMEVIRVNAELVTATSTCPPHSMDINDDPLGCSNPPAEIKWGDWVIPFPKAWCQLAMVNAMNQNLKPAGGIMLPTGFCNKLEQKLWKPFVNRLKR